MTNRSNKKKSSSKKRSQANPFPIEEKIHTELSSELKGIIEAFSITNRGFSVERMVADPLLNEDFQLACDRLSIPGTNAERNRFLLRIRKAGKLKAFKINTTIRTKIDWKQVGSFIYASEIAWRKISSKYVMSLDDIFCDPRYATQFDEIASSFAPGFKPLDYRWAALTLRKKGSNAKHQASLHSANELGISGLSKKGILKSPVMRVSDIDYKRIQPSPGVYVVRELDGTPLYAGETSDLASRLQRTFGSKGPLDQWLRGSSDLEVFYRQLPSVTDHRFARQSVLLKWHKPEWNLVEALSL